MRTLRRISVAVVALGALGGCPKPIPTPTLNLTPPLVRETFESGSINPAFWRCLRPENDISVTEEQARKGGKSLKLAINKLELFAHPGLPKALIAEAEAKACMKKLTQEEGRQFLNDESERAELWENKSQSPHFTEDFYYGFSLMIPRASAPLGDFNRMVVAQWKVQRAKPQPPDAPFDSPIVSVRVTGGFFHIMLDVKAALKDGAEHSPSDCKVLLAFTAQTPPNLSSALPKDYDVQCESRLNYDLNQGQPAPPKTLKIARSAFLPNLWKSDGTATWVDLVFHIRGGANGVVELWANEHPIATATGWIGYEGIDDHDSLQYFKVGPYRDPAGYDTIVYLDNLARGHSYGEVDPTKP